MLTPMIAARLVCDAPATGMFEGTGAPVVVGEVPPPVLEVVMGAMQDVSGPLWTKKGTETVLYDCAGMEALMMYHPCGTFTALQV